MEQGILMHRLKFPENSIPVLLLLITASAYGILVPKMGFYWDDWPLLWNAHTFGASGLVDIFRVSRPFLLPGILFLTGLLPENALAWQVCGILARFLTSLAAWWALKQIWPKAPLQTLTASLLFCVYPGFTQQWIPLTYVSQLLLPLAASLISLGLSARAMRQPQRSRVLTALSLLLMALGIFPTEYFIGLEVLRLLVIGLVRKELAPGQPRRILTIWWPYGLLWVANLAWLSYYYASGAYQYYEPQLAQTLGGSFGGNLARFAWETGNAFFQSGFLAWFHALPRLWARPGLGLPFLGLVAGCFLVLRVYLGRLDLSGQEARSLPWARQALVIGLAGILAGRLPSWIAGLPLRLNFGWDRFTLPMMLGACLALGGLLELLKSRRGRLGLASLLVALAAGQQYLHADAFREDWERQQEFLWQLAWRAPAIQPNTVLLTEELPLVYETDLSLSAPLNWLYAPGLQSRDIPYLLLSTDLRLGGPKLPRLEPDLPLEIRYSAGVFRGSTSDMLVFVMPASGCLKILEAGTAYEKTFFDLEPEFRFAISLSDVSRITPSGEPDLRAGPPLGPEPPHGWCYYFEKAELARQQQDYASVLALGRTALSQGQGPHDLREWFPFIEGYARSGHIGTAVQLSQSILNEAPYLKPGVCELWRQMKNNHLTLHPGERQVEEAMAELRCKLP